MGASDGTVIGVTKVLDQGADSSQWNLVIMGDGYTATEQGTYESNLDSFLDILAVAAPFSDPFVWERVNVHSVEVHSNETGADDPATCADGTLPWLGLETTAATYFDAAYCATGLRRLLTVDTALAMTTADTWVPEWDVVLVVVNHGEYGGSGSPGVAVAASANIWDGSIIHELGHAAFGLADEYQYYEGCDSGETTQDTYVGLEPLEANITMDPAAVGKWGLMVDPTTPLPTTTNPDPALCDLQPSPVADGTIGTFEGSGHFHSGLYRPEYTCRMRESTEDFCAVCANVIKTQVFADNPCFLATAVYGDPFAPEVRTLRAWRDRQLHAGGRRARLMHATSGVYERVGPVAARWVRPESWASGMLRRLVLNPWVRRERRRDLRRERARCQ